MMALFDEVKAAFLFEIWNISYDPETQNPLSAWDIKKFTPEGVSELISRKTIDGLVDESLIDRVDEASGDFEISARGIGYVESQLENSWSSLSKYADSKILGLSSSVPAADAWRKPDQMGELSATGISKIKGHLAESLKLIAESELSQEDKSQIYGLLKICEEILELPTPKLSLLKTILRWLKGVTEIADLIEKISEYISNA